MVLGRADEKGEREEHADADLEMGGVGWGGGRDGT